MDKEQLKEVYEMVDNIPFSRVKKNINRDFADGVMMAELIYHYYPKIVDLHNYPPANSHHQKVQNWIILNNKVLKKIGFNLNKNQIQDIAAGVPGLIEQFLYQIILKLQKIDQEDKLSDKASVKKNNQRQRDFNDNKSRDSKETDKINKKSNESIERRVVNTVNFQAEEILKLVSIIDQENMQLARLVKINKEKDQIIKNLQSKLEKMIFS